MKKFNNKGFTLIELLAVIVILIIVIFIAITKVRDSSLKAQLDSIRANAGTYVKAINSEASNVNIQEDSPFESGIVTVQRIQNLGINITGTKPDSGYVFMYDYEVTQGCFNYGPYYVEYKNGEVKTPQEGECEFDGNAVTEYAFTGDYKTFTAKLTGTYKVELWGAQGGQGAKGGYTSGIIQLEKGDILYVYVGQEGPSNQTVTNVGGWNGGGYSGNNSGSYSYGGGGATDVRLTKGSWNNAQSLNSRIMVAGGGGGGFSTTSNTCVPGVGGNLIGGDAGGNYSATTPGGGKQTTYGTSEGNSRHGSFGTGMQSHPSGWGGGGGGGYYGGSTGHGKAGAGGSSFISGYNGSIAVTSAIDSTPKSGCSENSYSYECSVHYSGVVFTDGDMRSGEEQMPTHNGENVMIGNSGDGYAKITLLSN